jgi:hypothetical protein
MKREALPNKPDPIKEFHPITTSQPEQKIAAARGAFSSAQ